MRHFFELERYFIEGGRESDVMKGCNFLKIERIGSEKKIGSG